jgi:hypothetical protein
MKKKGVILGLVLIYFGLIGCTTITEAAQGYYEPYTENVITHYQGVLENGKTVTVTAEEHDRIIAHIADVDRQNNRVYFKPPVAVYSATGDGPVYSEEGGMYQMPQIETETWRTYKGARWTAFTEEVTRQRFIEMERAKGKFSIGKTLLMALPLTIAGAIPGTIMINDEFLHPAAGAAIGFGISFIITGLINWFYQDVKFWQVDGVTFW